MNNNNNNNDVDNCTNRIPIVISAFGTVTKGLLKGLEDLEVGLQVKTIQTIALLRTARILRRGLETRVDLLSLRLQWKNHQLKLMWKTLNEKTIIIIIIIIIINFQNVPTDNVLNWRSYFSKEKKNWYFPKRLKQKNKTCIENKARRTYKETSIKSYRTAKGKTRKEETEEK